MKIIKKKKNQSKIKKVQKRLKKDDAAKVEEQQINTEEIVKKNQLKFVYIVLD